MKTSKAILLGILFSFFGFVIYGFVSIVRSGLHIERNHAVGIGALLGGTVYNPFSWIVTLTGFGAAFWMVRRTT